MNIITQYESIRSKHEKFTEKLEELIKSLLDAKKINYHLIESRTKTTESVRDKIKKKGTKYYASLDEIKDLSALRIIAYYQKDIETINKIIRKSFWIDSVNTVDKSKTMNNNEFGYLSNHYIIKVNTPRINLPEWSLFKNLNAEIQLRTVLQHSWAAISHELQYKSKSEVPSTLKRKLYRLAGLFELADEEFGAVKDRQMELNKAIKNKKEISNTKVYNEINFETLSNLFDSKNKTIQFYIKQAKAAGFDFDPPGPPDTRNAINRQFTEIISLLNSLSIKNIAKFEKFLNTSKDQAKEYFKLQFNSQLKERLKEKDKNRDDKWYASNNFIIILFLVNFLPSEELENYRNKKGWSNQIINRVTKTILLDRKNKSTVKN